MPVSKDFLPLIGSSGNQGGVTYEIDQSIRFNDNDTAYMYRNVDTTFSNKFTISYWVKRGNLSNQYHITWRDKRGSGYAYSYLAFFSNYLGFYEYGDHSVHGLVTKADYRTNRLFRDTSAWYHIVASIDYTDAASTDQVKLYVNGEKETSFSTETNNTSYAAQSQSTGSPNYLGIGYLYAVSSDYMDGYMAEINFVDGYAYGPEYFGEFNSSNIWIPKEYDGSYGTNGFYVKGEDSSDLGNDSSGNNKDFTTSGLAAHDQMIDTPTNNFCVMNYNNTHSNVTLSDGNLHALGSGTSIAYPSGATHLIPSSGKWYAEIRIVNRIQPHEYPTTGVFNNSVRALTTNSNNPGTNETGVSGAKDIGFGADERRLENGTNTDPWGTGVDDGNIAAIAIDMDNKKIWWGHNQTGSFVWQVSGNPNTGANPANTIDFNTTELIFGNGHYSNSEVHWNFGQDGTFGGALTAQGNADTNGIGNFYYPVPTGYMALCSKNMGS